MKKKLFSGILVTMFLATMVMVAFPARVSAQFPGGTVKIGIIGPKGRIPWDGLWGAAQIARDMINKEGEFAPGQKWEMPGPAGMLTVDGLAKVELVDINEHSVPMPDPKLAIDELIYKLNAHPDMQFLIGGFRSECVIPMTNMLCEYAAVHGRPIWIICGAATGTNPPVEAADYEEYKYMFRVTPLNSTMLAMSFAAVIGQLIAPKISALYNNGLANVPVPTYVIFENLVWCDEMLNFVTSPYGQAAMQINVLGVRQPSPVATDFSAEIAAATKAGAKLVIHAFSDVAGASFIRQYGAIKPNFALVGINIESQMQEFYEYVDGACEYETILAPAPTQDGLTAAESMNPSAKPLTSNVFWDIYNERYHVLWDDPPIYTAWGVYDAIIGLNETSYDPVGSGHASAGKGWTVHVKNKDINKLIQHMETLGVSDGFGWKRPGGFRNSILGKFRYTGTNGKRHDVFCSMETVSPLSPLGCVRALAVQWQDGRLESVYPRDTPYARKWMFPPWMYSLETDFAGGDLVSTGVGDGNFYPMPDGVVDVTDLACIAYAWFSEPTYDLLEADMQPYNHFIDVYDAARIGQDWT